MLFRIGDGIRARCERAQAAQAALPEALHAVRPPEQEVILASIAEPTSSHRAMHEMEKSCINYNVKISPKPLMWQDSSFGDGDNLRSRIGFIGIMFRSSITWGSRLHHTFALSIVEDK